MNEARGGSGDEDVEAHVVCVGVELRLTWGNDGVDGAGASRHGGKAGGVRWPRRGVAALLLALGMVRKSARGRPERKQRARGKERGVWALSWRGEGVRGGLEGAGVVVASSPRSASTELLGSAGWKTTRWASRAGPAGEVGLAPGER